MEPTRTDTGAGLSRARVGDALRRRGNWEQLAKFCVVGATGYVVNLVVYTALLRGLDVHYIPAAVGSFLVAVTNNYTWNRLWTFHHSRGPVVMQGLRFFVVSALALFANLIVLHLLVQLGVGEVAAQAIAIVLVTPVNFVGNKLWSFRPRRER
jgi:dolichol-phosphate mannosyltransferase